MANFVFLDNKRVVKYFSIAIACFTFLIFSCSSKKEKSKSESITLISAPVFNEDSAFSFVKKQVDFGPRIPNTSAHEKCAQYFINKLKAYQWTIIEQNFSAESFDEKTLFGKNIIASYNPSAKKRIILASHWDTRPFADQDEANPKAQIDGANDGASGVGVLLELARIIAISDKKPDIGIDIILFDVEDYGQPDDSGFPEKENTWCLGSQYWANNKHIPNYSAFYGILLDMVGGYNAKFYIEGTSAHFAPEVNRNVWNLASQIGYSSYFIPLKVESIVDDHYFVNSIAKIPMIDIIQYENTDGNFFASYWHTQKDNLNAVDKNSLKAVGQTLLQVVYSEPK